MWKAARSPGSRQDQKPDPPRAAAPQKVVAQPASGLAGGQAPLPGGAAPQSAAVASVFSHWADGPGQVSTAGAGEARPALPGEGGGAKAEPPLKEGQPGGAAARQQGGLDPGQGYGDPAEKSAPADPVERASYDYRRPLMHGGPSLGNIYNHLELNQGEPLYGGTLLRLIRDGDPGARPPMPPDPATYQALIKTHGKAPAVSGALRAIGSMDAADRDQAAVDQQFQGRTSAIDQREHMQLDVNLLADAQRGFRGDGIEYGDPKRHAGVDAAIYQEELVHNAQRGGRLGAMATVNPGEAAVTESALATAEGSGALQTGDLKDPALRGQSLEGVQALVQQAQSSYRDKRAITDALDQRLAFELSGLGPALTGPECKAYVAKFRASHQAQYDAETTAAAHLSQVMAQYGPALHGLVSGGGSAANDPVTAGAIQTQLPAYQALSLSSSLPALTSALAWTEQVLPSDPGKRPDPAYAPFRQQIEQIRDHAQNSFVSVLLAQLQAGIDPKGDPGAVGAGLAQRMQTYIIDPLRGVLSAKDLGDLTELQALYRRVKEITPQALDAKTTIAAARLSGQMDPEGRVRVQKLMKVVQELMEEARKEGPIENSIGRRAFRCAIDAFGIYAQGNLASLPGNAAEDLKATLTTDTRGVLAGGQELLGLGGQLSQGPDAVAKDRVFGAIEKIFSEKKFFFEVLPTIGLVGSAAAAARDYERLQGMNGKDVRLVTVVAAELVGDVFCAAGSAMEMMPPPIDAAGVLLNVLGGALSSIGGALEGLMGKAPVDPIQAEKADLLGSIRKDEKKPAADVPALSDPNAGDNIRCAADHGLDQAYIDGLATRCPALLKTRDAMTSMDHLRTYLAEKHHLARGAAAGLRAFLDALLGGPPGAVQGLIGLASTCVLNVSGHVSLDPDTDQAIMFHAGHVFPPGVLPRSG